MNGKKSKIQLPSNIVEIFNALIYRIVQSYKPKCIILFGSYARGDWHIGSDIDLLIIKNTDQRFIDRIGDILECCTGEVAVEPLVYTEDEIESMLARGNDFIMTILEEGVVVYEEQQSDGSAALASTSGV